MKKLNTLVKELRSFLILWVTQSLSSLGSSMTNFALVIWSYQEQGLALSTALLSVCSYAPYVIMSIFAGAISDKWNKKVTMLVSDSAAALCTVIVMVLLLTHRLEIWHLYVLNGINGLMNTIQQPAAGSLLTNLFGVGKGSGAQMLFFLIGIAGVIVCLVFRRDSHIWALEDRTKDNA